MKKLGKMIMSKVRILTLACFGLFVIAQNASAQAVPYFELPADFSLNMIATLQLAGVIILGITAFIVGYKVVVRLLKGASA